MKRILITGVNSYVGNSLETWLQQYSDEYQVDKISVRDDSWKNQDFSQHDSIVHVAGIAHVSRDPKMEELYYRVNRDLTIDIANKAKRENVKQFIFLSSIIVYGENTQNGGIITKDTIPNPSNFYGNSKLQAEKGIEPLCDESFQVAIVRPPMIYGKGSKGNYPRLAKLARTSPVFPDIDNKRSMLHIDNLSEFIKLLIDHNDSGLYFPQNEKYVKTSYLVKTIAEVHHEKIKLIKIFNPFLHIMRKRKGIVNKVFGDLVYEESLSNYIVDYRVRSFLETIELTELERK